MIRSRMFLPMLLLVRGLTLASTHDIGSSLVVSSSHPAFHDPVTPVPLSEVITANPMTQLHTITPNTIECICINGLTCVGVTNFHCDFVPGRSGDHCFDCDRGCASYGGRCR